MLIQRLTTAVPSPDGVPTASQPLMPQLQARLPFASRIVTVAPGAATRPHEHHECEIWLVITGRAELVEDQQRQVVEPGDAIYLPPLGHHELRNLSAAEPLTFLTIYWEDMAAFEAVHVRRMAATSISADSRYLILPSFPTPNGDLHVGHLAGPYLGADLCRRWLTMRGVEARILLGTVGHQSQVAVQAQKLGKTFYETAEHNTSQIIETLKAADIRPDVFIRPTSTPQYAEIARAVFEQLLRDGAVVLRQGTVSYCERCERYLFEAFVIGECPFCHKTGAGGNECEACGLFHDDAELVEPRCSTCGMPAVQRQLERFYFPLEAQRARLAEFFNHVHAAPGLRAFISRVMAGPLPDVPVSYVAATGVGLGLRGYEEQKLYSPFELAPRFLAAIQQLAASQTPASDWKTFCRSRETRTVVLFGSDNAYLRAFIFPAVLGAFTDAVPLPASLIVNEFYRLHGDKFSTSRNHAIWGRELVAVASSDTVRYYLALTRPEIQQTSFTPQAFKDAVETELIGSWQGWLQHLGERLERRFGGVAPEAGAWTDEAHDFYEEIRRAAASVQHAYDPTTFSSRRACRALHGLVRSAERFSRACEEFNSLPDLTSYTRTHLALELMAARSLALSAAPIMPVFAEQLLRALGETGSQEDRRWDPSPAWVPAGRKPVGLGGPYFRSPAVYGFDGAAVTLTAEPAEIPAPIGGGS